MEIHLAPGQPATVSDPDELRRFSVIVAAPAGATLSLDSVVVFEGTDHAWVPVDWLVAASGRADSATWRVSFDGMLAYATKQGWVRDDPAAIRGHVVWQGG